MKVVYNACYGGFGISEEGEEFIKRFCEERLLPLPQGIDFLKDRTHPALVHAVEQLGPRASDAYADLQIFQSAAHGYYITEHDGFETVHTPKETEWVADRWGDWK